VSTLGGAKISAPRSSRPWQVRGARGGHLCIGAIAGHEEHVNTVSTSSMPAGTLSAVLSSLELRTSPSTLGRGTGTRISFPWVRCPGPPQAHVPRHPGAGTDCSEELRDEALGGEERG
jgi:hypothetical protein